MGNSQKSEFVSLSILSEDYCVPNKMVVKGEFTFIYILKRCHLLLFVLSDLKQGCRVQYIPLSMSFWGISIISKDREL